MYRINRHREKPAVIGRPKQQSVPFFHRTGPYCTANNRAHTSDGIHFINLQCKEARYALGRQFRISTKNLSAHKRENIFKYGLKYISPSSRKGEKIGELISATVTYVNATNVRVIMINQSTEVR